MKTFPLPRFLFCLIVGALLTVMGVFLLLAYIQFTKPEDTVLPHRIGTLQVNTDWRASLKDNSFFSSRELGKDYAYISELVDHLTIDLNFDYVDGPKDAPVSLDYQVNGTLRADYGAAGSTVQLLKLQYPQIAKGEAAKIGPDFSDSRSFELSLSPYNYLINGFQNAYSVPVTATLNLEILVNLSIQAQDKTAKNDLKLSLNIPLGNTVFQVSGTPSSKLEMFLPLSGVGKAAGTSGRALGFLMAAVAMAVLALLCFIFMAPEQPNKHDVMVKQTLQKIKSRMATLTTDPRPLAEFVLDVSDIADIIVLADEMAQPILHYAENQFHHLFVQYQGMLYAYRMGADDLPSKVQSADKVQ